jgi:hypothetical protein
MDSNIQAGTVTHPAGQAEGHVSLETFKKDLNSCLEGMKFRTTYDKVFVQILTWEGAAAEVGLGLRHDVKVFKNLMLSYNYHVLENVIPDDRSATKTAKTILHDFVSLVHKADCRTLGIFYYNGHSLYDPGNPNAPPCWSK